RVQSTLSCFVPFSQTNTTPTSIYTLSLHDALPIYIHDYFEKINKPQPKQEVKINANQLFQVFKKQFESDNDKAFVLNDTTRENLDRKSTRLNSSHVKISYAVFCLKKKKKKETK